MNQSHIRNFAIIAHVDHGKSTLSDRFLEITNTISKDKMREQFLDQNPISRERGITIKLAPVRMIYKIRNSTLRLPFGFAQGGRSGREFEIRNNLKIQNPNDQNELEIGNWKLENSNSEYILNLIDTPGHVDFSYEVSRTLAACEGAVLLVDATQGIQAQTVAHYHTAKKEGLVIVPVINKIDLANAQIEQTKKELVETFGFKKEEIILISAKTGENVEALLATIVEKVPPPRGLLQAPLRALIFDAVYDEHRGVVAYIRVVDGKLSTKERVLFYQSNKESEVTEVGYFLPSLSPSNELTTGEIGYIITGVKDIKQVRVGDTVTISNVKFQMSNFKSLPGYKIPKPMVFFGVYPKDTNDLGHLRESLTKLSLNDTSLSYSEEYSAYLGSGYRVGFLGLLHAEIVKQRLSQEFNLDLLFTQPQVLYKKEGEEILEPYMNLKIYVPKNYVGGVLKLVQRRKGTLLDLAYYDAYAVLIYDLPYSIFIRGLSQELKSISSGYASIDYSLSDYRKADVVNLEIRINDMPIDILSEYVYRDDALFYTREKVQKLKRLLDRQQFRQVIQAVLNGTIVAREEIPPFRKDVIAKLSGGDRTRKDKLLKKQKKGKSRLLATSKISIPQKALYSMIESK